MKYTLHLLALCMILVFSFSITSSVYAATPLSATGTLNTGWTDTGGGRYYDTTTGTYSNADGSVQAARSEVYDASVKTKVTETINAAIPDVTNQGLCTGEILYDIAAAQDCAKKAQAQATARGYTATCSVQVTDLHAIDPNSKTGMVFYPDCTINGQSGHGAQYIVGWQASAGSTAIIQGINPGWTTLLAELKGGATVPAGTSPVGSSTRPLGTRTSATTGAGTVGSGTAATITAGTTALISMYMNQLNAALNAINTPAIAVVQNGTQTTTTTGTQTSAGSCTVSTNLRFGDSGTEVSDLTGILVKEGLMTSTQTAFDNTVFKAVIAYQEKYKADILTPEGVDRGTGFVGPSTRNYMNAHSTCATAGAMVAPPTILNSDLRLGDRGQSVTLLTQVLMREGLMSAPQSTFDNTVFNAVIAYQEKYKAAILTPQGVDRGTGFVGVSTRNFMNAR